MPFERSFRVSSGAFLTGCAQLRTAIFAQFWLKRLTPTVRVVNQFFGILGFPVHNAHSWAQLEAIFGRLAGTCRFHRTECHIRCWTTIRVRVLLLWFHRQQEHMLFGMRRLHHFKIAIDSDNAEELDCAEEVRLLEYFVGKKSWFIQTLSCSLEWLHHFKIAIESDNAEGLDCWRG